MRPRLRFALIAVVLGAHPARAQIVRDTSLREPTPAPKTQPASLTPFDSARLLQVNFEHYRRRNLPLAGVIPRSCDEPIGKLCYGYDESATPPREPDAIKRRRADLITALDAMAKRVPDNTWIAEQRVRYLVESERFDDALHAARACAETGWRCEILVGLAHHMKGEYVAAEQAYEAALSHMPPNISCEWTDVSMLLDNVALGDYRTHKCGEPSRDAWASRTMFLARTLYTMAGNDSRTEFFARRTMVKMISDAPSAYQYDFSDDERELLLRFGWPRGWGSRPDLPFALALTNNPPPGTDGGPGSPGSVGGARGRGKGGTPVGSYPPGTKIPSSVPPLVRPPDAPGTRGLPGGLGGGPPEGRPQLPRIPNVEIVPNGSDGVFVVTFEATPAFRYIPPGFVLSRPPLTDSTEWRPHEPPVIARYAPPYAKSIVPLEHQKAVFRRGDSALVVMAYDTKRIPEMEHAMIRAGLAVTPAEEKPTEYVAVRDSAPPQGYFTVKAPFVPLLMSAEAAAPEKRLVARARYGIGPFQGADVRVALSDLLFYKTYGSAPRSAEEAAPHAIPTERVNAKDKLGVFWEAYGTNPDGEQMKVSLVVARERPDEAGGILGRLGRATGITRERTPVSVTVSDISARGARLSPRAIEFDISTLSRGAYVVQLEIEVAGQPTLRTEHRIEVVSP